MSDEVQPYIHLAKIISEAFKNILKEINVSPINESKLGECGRDIAIKLIEEKSKNMYVMLGKGDIDLEELFKNLTNVFLNIKMKEVEEKKILFVTISKRTHTYEFLV